MNTDKNPWTVLSASEIYENPWIRVTEYAVLNPAGRNGIYGKVHFRNQAIGVVPLDDDFNTYLVGQYRFPLEQYCWEIPEGGCPLGTDPLESAKRELAEETGLVARRWDKLMDIHTSNSVTDEHGTIFIARDIEQGEATPEETELLVVRKLPFETVYLMVMNGEITDSLSVAAILKIKLMMADGRL